MHYLQQLLFLLTLAGFSYWIYTRIQRIIANVQLGKDWLPAPTTAAERWQRVAVFALGQRRMFAKPVVGIMHMVIYLGFFLINVEILEIILDGLLGTHRLFAPLLGGLYPFLINFFEVLAFGVIAVCVVFLWRRNVAYIKRFRSSDLKGWAFRDANQILVAEIVLMKLFLTWNASDTILRGRAMAGVAGLEHFNVASLGTDTFWISGLYTWFFDGWSTEALLALERGTWWLHICGILGFAVYVTYSKHLHIGMGFPNIYWGRTQPVGQMQNMPDITREVRSMLGMPVSEETTVPATPGRFGAADVPDLTRKHLMDAYSCTECGRCSSVCPANITGKLLSPRKIMMDTRDRMEEIGAYQQKNKTTDIPKEKPLLDGYITREEILACTNCNACVEACPVTINPLDIILELRRYAVMEESKAPASWNSMFNNLENQQAPWAYPAADRLKWMEAN
jgi:heterodisulfide reductase subunit C